MAFDDFLEAVAPFLTARPLHQAHPGNARRAWLILRKTRSRSATFIARDSKSAIYCGGGTAFAPGVLGAPGANAVPPPK